jgi:hypothetical protein
MSDDPCAAADAARALDTLVAALRLFPRAPRPLAGYDAREIERWEDEGGPPESSRTPEAVARPLQKRSRDASTAQEQARRDIVQAVRTYTQVLRHARVPLPATLIAVALAVRGDATAHLSADACSAIRHDAARSCIEAYFGP